MPGVYVKGMAMPIQCVECPLRTMDQVKIRLYHVCEAINRIIEQPYGSRPEWCPLVEVPVHGRMIDVDAMERLMSDTVQGDIRGYPYSDTLWDTAFRWLDNQPTIIPAEEGNDG